MRSNLWTDPRVAMMCDLTGCAEPMVIGGLLWLWTTADQHTEDGFMPGLPAAAIDRKSGVAGLGEALLAVGWIELVAARPGSAGNPSGIKINHFDEHNGASAKKRMESPSVWRNTAGRGNCNATSVTDCAHQRYTSVS